MNRNSSHGMRTLSVLQTTKWKRKMMNKKNSTQVSESNTVLLSALRCKAFSEAARTRRFARCSTELKPAIADHFGGSHNKMATCKFCSETIEWEEVEDDDGYETRWQPTDPLTHLRHKCRKQSAIYIPRTYACYKCKAPITFGDLIGRRSGKKVPLDVSTKNPHECLAH
jgi:hypothetical protein